MQTAFANGAHRATLISCLAAPAMALAMASCTTPPVVAPQINPVERIQRDRALGTDIARGLDQQLKLKPDSQVTAYLEDLGQRLADATPELKSGTVTALVVREDGAWRQLAIPGHRLYLAAGLLKRVEFENQLAAAMAIELAHVQERHLIERVQEETARAGKATDAASSSGSVSAPATDPAHYPRIEGLVPTAPNRSGRSITYFGPSGVFTFPDAFHSSAVEQAVNILYRAGFDPRGLVSLLQMYRSDPERSPYGPELLEKLLEKARRGIALHAPLRNPIVRSQRFLAIQKRFRKL